MSELPNRLSPGQRLTAHWLNRLLDYLRSRELRAGPGARLTRTPSGTTLSLAARDAPAGASSPCGAVPAVVRSCSGGVYSVDLYADGIGARSTGRASLVLTEVQSLAPLAAGTVVLAHLQPAVAVASGSEPPAADGDGEEEEEEGEE